ncbi:hypothetical protein KA005_01730, partial [bacterium]|nr:hypothetical protein [bacterium]
MAKGDKEKRISELIGSYLQLGFSYFFYDANLMVLPSLRAANIAAKYNNRPHKMAHTFATLSTIYSFLALYKTALKVSDRAVAITEELNDPWLIGMNLDHRAVLMHYWGKNEEAIEDANEAIKNLLKSGDVFELGVAYMHRFWGQWHLGDIKAGMETAIEMDNIISRTGQKQMAQYNHLAYIISHSYYGNIDNAKSYVEKYSEQINQDDAFSVLGGFWIKGYMSLIIGEIDEAISELTAAKDLRERENLIHDYYVAIYGLLTQAILEKIRFGAVDKKERLRLLKTCKKNISKALSLSKKHPNYVPNAVLVSAIYNWIKGNKSKAKKL